METDLPDGGEVLAHHGVKGMRWGVITKKASAGRKATANALRKAGRGTARTVSGTVSATKTGVAKVQKARANRKAKVAEVKARKKFGNRSYKKISDSELKTRITRLEQEKRYRELKADRHLVRGREVTRQILEGSITKAGTYAGNKLLRSAFDNAFDGGLAAKAAKVDAAAGSKSAQKKAKKAAEAAEAAHQAVKEAYDVAFNQPKAPELPKAKPKPKPKQIEKPKSYKQTKPSPKPKRRPRNPGSPLK